METYTNDSLLRFFEEKGLDRRALLPHIEAIHSVVTNSGAKMAPLYEADYESIGRVLRAHLVIENFMDAFLAAFYGIEDLEGVKLRFDQKARLIPSRAPQAWKLRPAILDLNKIRNKFGHRIDHELISEDMCNIYASLAHWMPGEQFATHIDAIENFVVAVCSCFAIHSPELKDVVEQDPER